MHLHEAYIKEREDLNEIKTDRGFVLFKMEDGDCEIKHIFVIKEFRQQGHGRFLLNQVFELCKELGNKKVFAQIDIYKRGASIAKVAIENFGFDLDSEDGPFMNYHMEVSEWA